MKQNVKFSETVNLCVNGSYTQCPPGDWTASSLLLSDLISPYQHWDAPAGVSDLNLGPHTYMASVPPFSPRPTLYPLAFVPLGSERWIKSPGLNLGSTVRCRKWGKTVSGTRQQSFKSCSEFRTTFYSPHGAVRKVLPVLGP